MLRLVSAESVTGAREPEGEAWAIDEHDVEQAAREQVSSHGLGRAWSRAVGWVGLGKVGHGWVAHSL